MTGRRMPHTIGKNEPMKPTMILLLLGSQAVFGQSPRDQPTASPQRLRVGLRVDSPERQIRDVFATQLRKLEGVEVVPLPTGNDQRDFNDAHDVELRVSWLLKITALRSRWDGRHRCGVIRSPSQSLAQRTKTSKPRPRTTRPAKNHKQAS